MKCLLCPKTRAKESRYCKYHTKILQNARKRKADPFADAFRFAKYRQNIVAFMPQQDGTFRATYVGMNVNSVPKSKLIDLDVFCPGFTRPQVKKIKTAILALTQG